MTENENAQAETRWADEPVALDEVAKAELAKEKESAPVENLQNVTEPYVDEAQQNRDNLNAVLAQSIDGKSLSQRQVAHAQQMGLEYERINPTVAKAWTEWAEQSADHMGWLVSKLAAGELPSGPPSAHAEQLSGLGSRWQAQRELDALIAANPPGTPGYIQNQNRIQALYQFTSGDEPIVGRGLRSVR